MLVSFFLQCGLFNTSLLFKIDVEANSVHVIARFEASTKENVAKSADFSFFIVKKNASQKVRNMKLSCLHHVNNFWL